MRGLFKLINLSNSQLKVSLVDVSKIENGFRAFHADEVIVEAQSSKRNGTLDLAVKVIGDSDLINHLDFSFNANGLDIFGHSVQILDGVAVLQVVFNNLNEGFTLDCLVVNPSN
jgi:hypothetical protein